ncbi:hypothetical protein [Burkholderia sp. JP2-270]|nr:hypothetical protein [Burkholderia sp. JP2-270]
MARPLDSNIPGKFGDLSANIAVLPGFLQIGSEDFSPLRLFI